MDMENLNIIICMLACTDLLCEAVRIINSEDVSFYESVLSSEFSDGTGNSVDHYYNSVIDEPTTTEAGKEKASKHSHNRKHAKMPKLKRKKSHPLGRKKSDKVVKDKTNNNVGLGTKIHDFANTYLSQLIPMAYERYKSRIEGTQDDNFMPAGTFYQPGMGTSSPYFNIVNDVLSSGVVGLWNHPLSEKARNNIKSWIWKTKSQGAANVNANKPFTAKVKSDTNVKSFKQSQKPAKELLKMGKSNVKVPINVDRTKQQKNIRKFKLKTGVTKPRYKHIKIKQKKKSRLATILESRNAIKHKKFNFKKPISKLRKAKLRTQTGKVKPVVPRVLHKSNIGERLPVIVA